MNVRDLTDELSTLDPDQPVPASLALSCLDMDIDYIEDALSTWLAIAEMFGRTLNPEVEQFYGQLGRALTGT